MTMIMSLVTIWNRRATPNHLNVLVFMRCSWFPSYIVAILPPSYLLINSAQAHERRPGPCFMCFFSKGHHVHQNPTPVWTRLTWIWKPYKSTPDMQSVGRGHLSKKLQRAKTLPFSLNHRTSVLFSFFLHAKRFWCVHGCFLAQKKRDIWWSFLLAVLLSPIEPGRHFFVGTK